MEQFFKEKWAVDLTACQKKHKIQHLLQNIFIKSKKCVNEIIDQLGIGRATLYRYLRHRNVTVSATQQRKSAKFEILETADF